MCIKATSNTSASCQDQDIKCDQYWLYHKYCCPDITIGLSPPFFKCREDAAGKLYFATFPKRTMKQYARVYFNVTVGHFHIILFLILDWNC